MKKIVVGISGGIDSAVTAAIFRKQGFEVLGLHLKINPEEEKAQSATIAKIGEQLDIPITIMDVSNEFNEKIIEYFKSEHLAGNSPSPCAICNPTFKWKYLNDFSEKMGAKLIASGHYIQKTKINNKWYLEKGFDSQKDQSYFLWGLSQNILSKLTTPLGNRKKSDTRKLAEEFNLNFLIKQKESSGLCFAGSLNYPELISKHIPESKNIPGGDIINSKGNKIGTHKGYIYYTIGQKRDLEISNNKGNLCVIKIDAKKNLLVAGDPKELWQKTFKIRDFQFVDFEQGLSCKELEVKVRGFGWNPEGYGRITELKHNLLDIELENPAWAPAPGQPAVFYYKNLLLGGGIIV